MEWMKSHADAPSDHVAGVLASLLLLRPIDGAEVLKHHLSARVTYLSSQLSSFSPTGGQTTPSDLQSLTQLLSEVVTTVCVTIAQCGELYLSRPGVTEGPLLAKVTGVEDVGIRELTFDAGIASDSAEAAAWRRQQADACERIGGLPAAGVVLECGQWLEGLAPQLYPLFHNVLQTCDSGATLHAVEVALKETLMGWRYHLTGANAVSEELTWSDASQWVIGRPVSLWSLLFEGVLLECAKGLVAKEFLTVGSTTTESIRDAIAESLSLPPGTPGQVSLGHWSDVMELQPGSLETQGAQNGGGVLSRKSSATGIALRRTRSSSAPSATHPHALSWIVRANAILRVVDDSLQAALTAALAVSRPDSTLEAGAPGQRALVLEPYVQDRCQDAIEVVGTVLSEASEQLRMTLLGEGHLGSAAAPAACAALFVGRVAQGLADRSTPLHVLLGPPSAWEDAKSRRLNAPGFGSVRRAIVHPDGPGAPSLLLESVQNRLRQVAANAYSLWAVWAAKGLAVTLVNEVSNDGAFLEDTPVRGWEEAVLPAEGAPGSDEVRFLVPVAPSPAAMRAGFGACAEIDRAGGHAADAVAVQLLRWYLAGEVATTLGSETTGAKASEKGVVQLIFDLRFLTSLLDGAPPPGSMQAFGLDRRRQIAQAEAALSSRLDPIDWATYESVLFANAEGFIQHTRAVLGLASRGAISSKQRSSKGTSGSVSLSSQPVESNILRMAPVTPRFGYLPVNMPSVFRGQQAQQAQQHRQTTPVEVLLLNGEEAQYSFAKLSADRVGTYQAPKGQSAVDVTASMGAAALDALRHSGLGSLFGDKAAEMGSTLGEYSGLLSSLTSFKR